MELTEVSFTTGVASRVRIETHLVLIFQIVCSAYRPYTEFSTLLEHNDNVGYDTEVISFDLHVPPPIARKISLWWNVNYEDVNSYEEWSTWMVSLRLAAKSKLMFEGLDVKPRLVGTSGSKTHFLFCSRTSNFTTTCYHHLLTPPQLTTTTQHLMVIDDKSWTLLERHERAFYIGLEKFIDHCKPLVNSAGKIRCPCKSCRTILWVSIKHISDHIMRHGFDLGYKTWVHHSEPALPSPPPIIDNTRQPQMSDVTALLNDLSYIPPNNKHNEPTQGDIDETSNEPTQATRNEFKELYASANEELYPGYDYVTRLDFRAKFTYFKVNGKLTNSIFNEMLEFFLNVFPINKGYKLPSSYYVIKKTFKMIRWKDSNTPGNKIPKKVLHYFLIIPRLQRLYKSSHTAKKMIWHATGKCTDLGLQYVAGDFDDIQSASMVMYKREFFYADDRKGVETIDIASGQKFNMRAMVLWTINDFPARSSLSGWSGPTCNEDTPYVRVLSKTAYVGHRRFLKKPHKWRSSREFNGQTDNRDPPKEFDRDKILARLDRLPTRLTGKHSSYGGVKIIRNVLLELNWTKRSIFYELEYWSFLTLRYNLDIMHIEKNVLDTLLMNDKSKDTAKARQDLQRLGI
nr:hypothetical protein [Tanacetum cinerariifolium]